MPVLLLVLRGCPAGWLGAYGNEWVATPHLDRFASQSIVFDQHWSDCPEAVSATQAWLSGRYQFPAISSQPPAETPNASPRPAPLLDWLHQRGVRTILLRANHPDTDWVRPDCGWDEVLEARPQQEDASPLDELQRRFPEMLDRLGPTPDWLAWVEIDRLIPPWDVPLEVFEAYFDHEQPSAPAAPPSPDRPDPVGDSPPRDVGEDRLSPCHDPPIGPYDSADLDAWVWLRSSFAAVVTTLDAELGRLLHEFEKRGLGESATIIITSDLGWPMAEHGQVGPYRPWLHEEFVHLPLLIRLPQGREALRRVNALTQPCDLMPTILGFFGIDPPGGIPGQNLLPLLTGSGSDPRPYALCGLRQGEVAEWSLRTRSWAYLLAEGDASRQPMLFAKPEDRWEVNDVKGLHQESLEHFRGVLVEAIAGHDEGVCDRWPTLEPP